MAKTRKIARIYTTIVAFLVVSCCFAQMFTNVRATQVMTISSLTEARDGNIWFASGKTIYRFDGDVIYPMPSSVLDEAGAINCMFCNAAGQIIIGSERGLITYAPGKESFETDMTFKGVKVRTILEDGKSEWVATNRGLYQNRKLVSGKQDFLCASLSGKHLYATTANAVKIYDVTSGRCVEEQHFDAYITSVLGDDNGGATIGTSNSVFYYNEKDKSVKILAEGLPIVKCLVGDAKGTLFVGCDGGLYEVGKDVRHIVHDARNNSSIAGNVVWCMKNDRVGNLWVGTDNGISVKTNSQSLCIYPLFSITHGGEGNLVYCIMRDSKKRIWMGGSNGIVCVNNLNSASQSYRWYDMGSQDNPIPHSRIRMFYEDPVWGVWACTDGGLLHLDENTMQWTRHHIREDIHNWVYGIERESDALIVRTYDGVYRVRLDGDTLNVLQKVDVKTNLDNVYASTFIGDTEWKVSPNGLKITKGTDTHEVELPEKFVSIYYDANDNLLYLGGADKFAILDPQSFLNSNINEVWFNPDAHYAEENGDSIIMRWMVVIIIGVVLALMIVLALLFVQRRKMQKERERRQAVLRSAMDKMALLENDNLTLLHQLRLQQLSARSKDNVDSNSSEASSDDVNAEEQFMIQVTKMIEENIDNPDLSVVMLSDLMGISSKQLYRKIKQYTDLTAVEYIRKVRLQKASVLLGNDKFTINEVMYMVGFSNPSYFSRSFASEYGMPPTEYRLSLKGTE